MIDVVVQLTIDGDAAVVSQVRAGLANSALVRAWESALAGQMSRYLAETGSAAVSARVSLRERGSNLLGDEKKEPRSASECTERGSNKRSAPNGILIK